MTATLTKTTRSASPPSAPRRPAPPRWLGDTVTYDPGTAFISLPAGGTGTATFTYDISDGQGGTSQATVTVTVIGANDAPAPDR